MERANGQIETKKIERTGCVQKEERERGGKREREREGKTKTEGDG
jgi:hypothetical protein